MRVLLAVVFLMAASTVNAEDRDLLSDAEVKKERELKASAIYKSGYGDNGLDEITKAINEVSSRAIKKEFIARSIQKEQEQPKGFLSRLSIGMAPSIREQISDKGNLGRQLTIKTTTNTQGLYENIVFGGISYKVSTGSSTQIIR